MSSEDMTPSFMPASEFEDNYHGLDLVSVESLAGSLHSAPPVVPDVLDSSSSEDTNDGKSRAASVLTVGGNSADSIGPCTVSIKMEPGILSNSDNDLSVLQLTPSTDVSCGKNTRQENRLSVLEPQIYIYSAGVETGVMEPQIGMISSGQANVLCNVKMELEINNSNDDDVRPLSSPIMNVGLSKSAAANAKFFSSVRRSGSRKRKTPISDELVVDFPARSARKKKSPPHKQNDKQIRKTQSVRSSSPKVCSSRKRQLAEKVVSKKARISHKTAEEVVSKKVRSSRKTAEEVVSKKVRSSRKTAEEVVSKKVRSSRKTAEEVVSKKVRSSRKTAEEVVSKKVRSSRKTAEEVVSKKVRSSRKTAEEVVSKKVRSSRKTAEEVVSKKVRSSRKTGLSVKVIPKTEKDNSMRVKSFRTSKTGQFAMEVNSKTVGSTDLKEKTFGGREVVDERDSKMAACTSSGRRKKKMREDWRTQEEEQTEESTGSSNDTEKPDAKCQKIKYPGKHRCNICKREFRRLSDLKRHTCSLTRSNKPIKPLKNKYPGKNPCDVCGQGFRYPSGLRRHSMIHSNEPAFQCDICEAKFWYHNGKQSHMNSCHAAELAYKCDKCKVGFYTEKERDNHRLNYSMCKDRYKFTCEYCPKSFTRTKLLKEHEMIHVGQNPFSCELCEKSFKSQWGLREHQYTHPELGPKPHGCASCELRFQTKRRLRQHVAKVHEKSSEFVCEYCPKYFRVKESLEAHRMTHKNEYLHLCSICGFGCNWRLSFQNHMLKHTGMTGETKHICEECSRSFSTKRSLKEHMIDHTGDFPHKCHKCAAKFKRLTHLKTHMITHSDAHPFKCSQCKKAFKRRDYLEAHILTHSDLKPFECTLCEAQYNNLSNLRAHMCRIHNVKSEYKYERTNSNIYQRLGIKGLVKSIEADNSTEKKASAVNYDESLKNDL